ncbi:MAG: hypothetical protein ACRCW1_05695 [Anaerotignaceae bacterium]
MKELIEILTPLKHKLNLEKFVQNLLLMLSVGLGITFSVLVFSKFFYIRNLWLIIGAVFVAVVVCSVVITIMKKASLKEIATVADSLGLKERVTTALEVDNTTAFSTLVLEDAIKNTKNINFKKEYKIKPPKHLIITAVLMSIAIGTTGFIKNPNIIDIGSLLKTEIAQLEEAKKVINSQTNLDTEYLKALNKEVNALTKTLKTATSKNEAQLAMDKAQQQLKALEKQGVSKDLDNLSQTLQDNTATKELGDAIKSGNTQEMSTALEELNNTISGLTPEQKEALANQLKDLSQTATDTNIKDALTTLSNGLNNGTLSASDLEKAKDALSTTTKQSNDLKNSVEDLNKLIAQSNNTLLDESAKTNTNQSGNLEGNGKGQGEGSGKGEGSGEGASTGGGRGNSHAEVDEEYTRTQDSKDGYDTKIDSIENQSDNIEYTKESITGSDGEKVDYENVVGEYKEEALKSLDESNIPYGLKEIVSDYFSSLEK